MGYQNGTSFGKERKISKYTENYCHPFWGGSLIIQQYMNGYSEGYYNIIVTQYQPDDFEHYLNECEIIYDKKKMNGKYQVGSGRIVTFTHDTPFINNSILHNSEFVKEDFSLKESNDTLRTANGELLDTKFSYNSLVSLPDMEVPVIGAETDIKFTNDGRIDKAYIFKAVRDKCEKIITKKENLLMLPMFRHLEERLSSRVEA